MVFLTEFFEKSDFVKGQQTTKGMQITQPGASLRAKYKYAGVGMGGGVPLPYVRKKNQNMN